MTSRRPALACKAVVVASVGVVSAFHASTSSTTYSSLSRNGLTSFPIFRGGREILKSISEDTATSIDEVTTSKSKSSPFDNFNYLDHWYPVAWLRDLPVDKPTKVTVFDVDYVVSRTDSRGGNDEDQKVISVVDRCPHKSAALSEGRVTSCGKRFQCAYHGWIFDGKDGVCVEIPQTVSPENVMLGETSFVARGRADATAVPAMVSQGMVWLFPGGNLEKALLSPPPPKIPEMDMPEYKVQHVVRDFPIDWPILIENILDPDHGLFAHQMPSFDMYSASRDAPQVVTEEWTDDGKGLTLTASVDAVKKLQKVNNMRQGTKDMKKSSKDASPLNATNIFQAPSVITTARRDENGVSTNIIAFFICPTGTGKSRFMSASVAKIPFVPPRWLTHILLNNFIDQDTYLLATQQKHVLEAEAKATSSDTFGSTNARKKLYVYRSPTEKISAKLASFFDSTLPRAPNRLAALSALKNAPLAPNPLRTSVLDRYEQHTRICPDSKDVVKNCNRALSASKILSVFVLFTKGLTFVHNDSANIVLSRLNAILKPMVLGMVLCLSAATTWIAKKIKRGFYFKYTESYRDRDMKKIPKVWMDPA